MTRIEGSTVDQTDLVDFFSHLGSKDIYYCPNPGNAGDSAIALSTYTLFERVGIDYRFIPWNSDFDSRGKNLIYSGGGNLASNYPHARTFLDKHHERAERIVVLPHTIKGHEDLLRRLGPNVDIFCRERRSYDWVNRHTSGARFHLADDLALLLDVDQLLQQQTISRLRLAGQLVGRPLSEIVKRIKPGESSRAGLSLRTSAEEGSKALLRLASPVRNGHLYAIRGDRESIGSAPPPGNIDASALFSYGVSPKSTALRATLSLLSFLDQFEMVSTNRLHICILAAMLGKRVRLYANSYFKNEEVFRFSLQERFRNVTWNGTWLGVSEE